MQSSCLVFFTESPVKEILKVQHAIRAVYRYMSIIHGGRSRHN